MWGEEHPDIVVNFPTNSPVRMAAVIDRFTVAAAEGDVHHVEDAEFDVQIANARLRPARSGRTLDVAYPDRPIVAVQAALLAFEAAAAMPAAAAPPFVAIEWV
jgi:hypothetical protein